jgi:hypothetical protein
MKKSRLFIEWVDFQVQVLGSRKSVARRVGIHENTISRIANHRKTVGRKTIQAFRKAFGLSEHDYLLGPELYRRKLIEAPLDSSCLTLVYPLRHLRNSLEESFCCWSVWRHHHQVNFQDYVHIYVDVEDCGLPIGVEAVINVNREPSQGNTVLIRAASENNLEPHPHFAQWHKEHILSSGESLFGVLEYVLSD